MAIYDRQNNSSSTALPSQDLGSVIVQSLQNAVNSMKGNDTNSMDVLKESIKQAIDESSLSKTTEATSKNVNMLIKDNTKATTKEKVADKRDDEMLKLLKQQNDREKKEAKDNVQAQRARAQKNAKDRHKDIMGKGGFGSVQAIGSTILKTILKGLVIVLLVMEVIAAVKYAWKWLWGVKIPELITRIRLWFTGIVAKVTTQIKNFFINLFKPIAEFFHIKNFGLSEEDKAKIKELESKKEYQNFMEASKNAQENMATATANALGAFKTIEASTAFDISGIIDKSELEKAINERDTVKVEQLTSKVIRALKNEAERRGNATGGKVDGEWLDRGAHSLEDAANTLSDYFVNKQGPGASKGIFYQAVSDFNQVAKNNPTGFGYYQEIENLRNNVGKENPEDAAKAAQAKAYMEMLGTGQVTSATDQTLGKDEYYGEIVNAVHTTMEKNNLKPVYQENKALEWIQTTGDKWINTFKETMNDLLQNVGVKADIRLEYSNHGQAAWAPSSGGAPGTRS